LEFPFHVASFQPPLAKDLDVPSETQDPAPAPNSVEDLLARVRALDGQLPRRLQQCADHVLAHSDRIALSTVAQFSTEAGVPASAMMRFCQQFGFSGYTELQRLFRDVLSTRLPDYATRLARLKEGPAGHPSQLVAEFVEAGRLSMESLARDLDEIKLEQAVAALSAANVIHLVGFRRSFAVTAYLAYVLQKLEVPAVLHHGIGGSDQQVTLQPGDALLAVTFTPYSGETLALMRAARDRAIPVVALTEPPGTGLTGIADIVLGVTEVDFGAFRSLSATIALALSIALAVAARRER
jgi:DNA-binding MurR/RpiR family transcriptional regulator